MLTGLTIRTALVLALVGIVLGRSDDASAQARTLREAMVGSAATDGRDRSSTPAAAHYVSESGDRFIFDRSERPGRTALLQFDNGLEIWALRPTPGPRGDIIYKNDLDQPVVRTTPLGGLTLFTRENPEGMPAAVTGPARPFRPPVLTPAQVLNILTKSSERASRTVRRVIPFEAGVRGQEVTPSSAYLVADAAGITAEAISRLAVTARGRMALTRVLKVKILYGPRPTARLTQGVLEIIITPKMGMAGRPSSGVIMRIIGSR